MKAPDHPFHFQNQHEWRAWLEQHHATQPEAWLLILKSRAAGPGIYLEEATEEAAAFGWVDSVLKSVSGESFFYLRFTPRKPGSLWSVSNQKRVERLIAQGRMTEAGMAKVREAMENGEWEAAIRREETSSLPDDLRRALETNVASAANFENYPASQKKMFLYWIASARTEKTRQKRIHAAVEMAAQNKRFG